MNNKSILMLRTTDLGVTVSVQNIALLDGQPLYNKQKNYLTIGTGTSAKANNKPITVRELVGYFEDNANITNSKTTEYSIRPSTSDSIHTLNIDNKNGFIKLRTNNIDRLSINNNGNVGIGTAPDTNNTNYKLKILGDVYELGSITTTGNVVITDETPSTDTSGALNVTGGVKAKNLYIVSEDLTNTIKGTTNTVEGSTLNSIKGTTTINDNGNDNYISLIHNSSNDNNKLVLSKSGVEITKDTSASSTGAALSVTGGIKAKNLYIASTDKDNTISGKSITLAGTTKIELLGKAYATNPPTSDTEIVRFIDLYYDQEFFNNLYSTPVSST